MLESLPSKGAWEHSGRPKRPTDRRHGTRRADVERAGGPARFGATIFGTREEHQIGPERPPRAVLRPECRPSGSVGGVDGALRWSLWAKTVFFRIANIPTVIARFLWSGQVRNLRGTSLGPPKCDKMSPKSALEGCWGAVRSPKTPPGQTGGHQKE